MTLIRRLFLLITLTGIVWAFSGCASTKEESDLPWNMPQTWESAPTMPFGTTGSY